jgi:hypothetical protein
MLKALEEQMQMPDIDSLSFEQRLGLMADREITPPNRSSYQAHLRFRQ